MEKFIHKAEVLIEALPYMNKFRGKTFVIKYGGSAMIDEELKKNIVQDIILLSAVGIFPVLIHGGGPEINNLTERLGINNEFIQGLRITDKETSEIAEMVLVGKVNRMIVAMINQFGGKSVGLSGKDGKLIIARKKSPIKTLNDSGEEETVDLGYVGSIDGINTEILNILKETGFIPVIAPTAPSPDGGTFNINADTAAGAIAGSLKAEKLIMLSDQQGILKIQDDSNSLIQKININEVNSLIKDGVISGGMIPKIYACMNAINKGVKDIHIIDGRVKHSILLEIFTDSGIGTMIYKD